ncbi:TadE family type IV pilus minor pilin [Salinifilum aidingensis]
MTRRAAAGSDRGAVTVEAAVGICAVVAVFALLLLGVGAAVAQLRCTDAAVEAARMAARGDRERAHAALAQLAPEGASLRFSGDVEYVRAEVVVPAPTGVLDLRVTAEAVAAREPGAPSP